MGKAAAAPYRSGDIPANYLNAAKASRILNWKAAVSLNEGVNKTYEYFKNRQ
jgi:nucleoside-diphosphate-sugar epimerase